jgi:hypothetical protein
MRTRLGLLDLSLVRAQRAELVEERLVREEVDVLDVVVRLPLALVFLFRFPGRASVRGGDGGGRDRASAEGEKRRRRRRRATMIRRSSFVAAAFDAHRRRDEGEEEEDAETIARSDATPKRAHLGWMPFRMHRRRKSASLS